MLARVLEQREWCFLTKFRSLRHLIAREIPKNIYNFAWGTQTHELSSRHTFSKKHFKSHYCDTEHHSAKDFSIVSYLVLVRPPHSQTITTWLFSTNASGSKRICFLLCCILFFCDPHTHTWQTLNDCPREKHLDPLAVLTNKSHSMSKFSVLWKCIIIAHQSTHEL
jgi:hypothetical protein